MSLKAERSKELTKLLGTRNVYGDVLAELGEKYQNIVNSSNKERETL